MKRLTLIAATMLCIVTGMKAQDADSKYATELLPPGTEAPDFTIANSGTSDGTSLSSLRGRYVVLDFWASWCPDCRKDIPSMRQLYERFSSDSIVFIGISFDKDASAWRKCVADSSMTWLQHSELRPWKETQISQDYSIKWIPSIYLIDPDGRVMLATVEIGKLARALENIAASDRLAAVDKQAASAKDAGAQPYSPDKVSGDVVEARFDGGMIALEAYLKNNIRYPEAAVQLKAEGRAVMHFTLNADGTVADITATDCTMTYCNRSVFDRMTAAEQADVRKAVVKSFAKEGYRVIKTMPRWQPAADGKAVRMRFPVRFSFVHL